MRRERLSGGVWIPNWVRYEHQKRYEFCTQFVRDRVVFDCASGDGTGSRLFARHGARLVLGCDQSPELVGFRGSTVERLFLTRGNAEAIPLRDRSTDVYACLETIEHVENDRALLAEAVRVLKPDGVFICSTPNRSLTNPGSAIWDQPDNPFHLREYSEPELRQLLGEYFGHLTIHGQNPIGRARARLMQRIAERAGRLVAVRLNQLLKLPRLLFDRPQAHRVRQDGELFEYLVVICRSPRI
jgi:ubiquinone/menaquinone biosynthesis C-methylase UbiE